MVICAASACDDDVIYDFAPYTLNINVVDKEGNNLLDPDIEGNITGETIVMDYDGQTYLMNNIGNSYPEMSTPVSRAYMPHFYGLVLTSINGPWHLSFGEIDAAVSAEHNMVLRIPSRGINKHFNVVISSKHDDVTFKLKVDGKKHKPAGEYTIVL